jgi:hypothetical protein
MIRQVTHHEIGFIKLMKYLLRLMKYIDTAALPETLKSHTLFVVLIIKK